MNQNNTNKTATTTNKNQAVPSTLSAQEMEKAIQEIKEVINHMNDCSSMYQDARQEITALKQWGNGLIVENENLKSTVDYLTKKLHAKTNGNTNYDESTNDELIKTLSEAFKNRLFIETEEKELAFKLLKRLDLKMDKVLTTSGMLSLSGMNASEIVLDIKQEFSKIRTAVGARLACECWSVQGRLVAEYFEERGIGKSDKNKDEDTKMDV